MRLHTSLPAHTVHGLAQRVPAVGVARFSEHRSRTHTRALEVILSGSGNDGGQWGTLDCKTATWDEWGVFLGSLYQRDTDMRCGSNVARPIYANRSHFRWATGRRYDRLTVADQHLRHRWEWDGDSITGAYRVEECACGAVRRFGSPDYVRQEFPAAVPAGTVTDRLERLTANVAQLHAEIDAEYPYSRAKDLAEIAEVEAEDRRILAGVRS